MTGSPVTSLLIHKLNQQLKAKSTKKLLAVQLLFRANTWSKNWATAAQAVESENTHHCKLIFVQMTIFIYVTQVPNLTAGDTHDKKKNEAIQQYSMKN